MINRLIKKIDFYDKIFQVLFILTSFLLFFLLFTFDGWLDFDESVYILILVIFFVFFVMKKLVRRVLRLKNDDRLILIVVLFLLNLILGSFDFFLSFLSLLFIRIAIEILRISFKDYKFRINKFRKVVKSKFYN